MPGKSFREQRVRAGIRANLADNFNVIYQDNGLTSPAISCHCTNNQSAQPLWDCRLWEKANTLPPYPDVQDLRPPQKATKGLK